MASESVSNTSSNTSQNFTPPTPPPTPQKPIKSSEAPPPAAPPQSRPEPQRVGPDAVPSILPAPPSLAQTQDRLRNMVTDAVKSQGGLAMLTSANLQEHLAQPTSHYFSAPRKAYRALQEALSDSKRAMKALNRFSVSNFKTPAPDNREETKRYNEAFNALRQAVKAQDQLAKALGDYGPLAGNEETARFCLTRQLDCGRRSAELINFASKAAKPDLYDKSGDLSSGKPISRVLDGLAADMHGHSQLLRDELKTQADALFTDLAVLAGEKAGLPADQMMIKAAQLTTRINDLKTRLADTLIPRPVEASGPSEAPYEPRPAEASGPSRTNPETTSELVPFAAAPPSLIYDTVMFDAFSHSLDMASERVNALAANPDPKPYLQQTVEQLYSTADLASLEREAGLPKNLHNQFISLERDIGAFKDNMGQQCTTKDIDQAKSDLSDRHTALCNTVRTLYEDIKRYIETNKQLKNKNQLVLFMAHLRQSPMGELGIPRTEAGLKEVAAMKRNMAEPLPFHTGEYLALAFGNTVSVDTLVECYSRGIAPQYMELAADAKNLTSHKTLGHGIANNVTLCSYKDAHGETRELVFKPEYAARNGLALLNVHNTGYSNATSVLQLNLASADVAKAMGAEGIIARSSAGSFNGQFGLFMERAPGQTAYALSRNLDTTMMSLNMLEEKGLLDLARANLQRELCKLEWADLLSGQVDRHGDNYLIDINPLTGDVRVTGIDNDASFGAAIVGPGLIDRNLVAPAVKDKLLPPADSEASQRLDFNEPSLQNSKATNNVRNVLGFNQLTIPTVIDISTYNFLSAIDEDAYNAYEATLRRNITDDKVVKSAMSRLVGAKTLAEELKSQGKVVDNWQDKATDIDAHYKQVETEHNTTYGKDRGSRIRLPFYLRDHFKRFFVS